MIATISPCPTRSVLKDDNASAAGYLGHDSVSLSMNESGGTVSASGIVGSGYANLQESGGSVMGDVSTCHGIATVDVQVRDDGRGARSFSGYLGDCFVNLQERGGVVSGLVGNRSVTVKESDCGSDTVFDGKVANGFVNVTVSGHGVVCDPVVVLLGLTD